MPFSQRRHSFQSYPTKRHYGYFKLLWGIPRALGFISYAVVKGFSGRAREISWLTYLLAIVLVVYFVFVRSRMG